MENFWMYQVEKLEEEEAKRKERMEKHEEDEVLMNVWLSICGEVCRSKYLDTEAGSQKIVINYSLFFSCNTETVFSKQEYSLSIVDLLERPDG